MDPAIFMGYFVIAFLAATLMLAIEANKKLKNNPETPDCFNLRFFLRDNLLVIVINILTIAFSIRFCNEILGSEITGWASFLIGIGLNWIILRIETFSNNGRKPKAISKRPTTKKKTTTIKKKTNEKTCNPRRTGSNR